MNSMISYDANVIGKKIRDIRKKNGYTQTKLSEQLMLSVDSVSNIENGRTTCMPEHIMRLCSCLMYQQIIYILVGILF